MAKQKKQDIGFTREEVAVIDGLVSAWNAFVEMTPIHSDETRDFRFHINACQAIMGLRVAQRAEPKRWRKP